VGQLLLPIKLISLALIALLSGCVNKMPPLAEPLGIKTAQNWNAQNYTLVLRQVFTTPENTEMQQYITEVLNNNPSLRSVAASAKAAAYGINITKAETLPHADLNFTRNQGKDSLTKETSRSASASIDINWALDVWGRFSDDAAATQFISAKVKYGLLQSKRVFIIQAVQAWVEYSNFIRIEKDLNRLNSTLTQLLNHSRENYEAGLIPYEFFLDAKNSQQRSQSRLQEIQLERIKSLQGMNILRGHSPSDELNIHDSKVPLTLVDLPDKISSASLANRPDIQAAFAEVQAISHSARSAHKALLPQINLTGSALKSGETLKKAFHGDLIWQLVGGLTQPLFHGGQLKVIANQKSAEAEASWWQYQRIVLQALLEVEHAMVSDKSFSQRIEQNQSRLRSQELKYFSAEERFSNGDLPLSDFLHVKAEMIEAHIELREIELQYINNRLVLVKSLGLPIETLWGTNNEKS